MKALCLDMSKKGLRDRNSPRCTLSQNGYGARVDPTCLASAALSRTLTGPQAPEGESRRGGLRLVRRGLMAKPGVGAHQKFHLTKKIFK